MCPRPEAWRKVYAMLPGKGFKAGRYRPMRIPVIPVSGWNQMDLFIYRLTFQDHLEWASEHGNLEAVYAFICALPESAWIHCQDKA